MIFWHQLLSTVNFRFGLSCEDQNGKLDTTQQKVKEVKPERSGNLEEFLPLKECLQMP